MSVVAGTLYIYNVQSLDPHGGRNLSLPNNHVKGYLTLITHHFCSCRDYFEPR